MPNEDKLVLVLHEMQHALVGMQQLLGVQSNIILQLLKETPEKSAFAKSLAFNQGIARSMENLTKWNHAKDRGKDELITAAITMLESAYHEVQIGDEGAVTTYRSAVTYAVRQLRNAIGEQETS